MEMSTMDMCIFLNNNYDLFEIALEKHCEDWRISVEAPEEDEEDC